jgi:hypothetical protein
VIINSTFDSLPQILNISGANQKRTAIVLLYDIKSVVIYFQKICIADESPHEAEPFLTLFEYHLIGSHWFLKER